MFTNKMVGKLNITNRNGKTVHIKLEKIALTEVEVVEETEGTEVIPA